MEYLYCIQTLDDDFIEGKKYLIVEKIGLKSYKLIDESGLKHDITDGHSGWLKYFKTKNEIRTIKLQKIINE